jgi:hypothetical protein
MDVNQATPRAIINWSSFNIGSARSSISRSRTALR